MHIRQAKLDDTQGISQLFRKQIQTWQRLNAEGQVEDLPYETLSIYERWLHGGPWMSVETGAIHLSHLLRRGVSALVAEDKGQILAYSELYPGQEPAPFGNYLSMTHPRVDPAQGEAALQTALLDAAREQAKQQDCERLLVSVTLPEARDFYSDQGLEPLSEIRRYSLSARTGQGFYVTNEHPDDRPRQIQGWYMPVGRLSSARQQWESLWPDTWAAVLETSQQRTHRLHFNASGQEAFVCCQQQMYIPRNADVYCWSPRPLSSQLLTAIRDWSHREGYRTLMMAVNAVNAKVLGSEAEADSYVVTVYGTV